MGHKNAVLCLPDSLLTLLQSFLVCHGPSTNYRRVPPERPPSFIRPPPPLFFHIERIGTVNAPPPSFIRPPPPFPSILLPVISHPTLPPCIMKCQYVRDISRGTWPTIVSAFTNHDAHSMIVHDPVGVAVVVRQWRGSKHFCKWPPFAHRRSRHLTAHA